MPVYAKYNQTLFSRAYTCTFYKLYCNINEGLMQKGFNLRLSGKIRTLWGITLIANYMCLKFKKVNLNSLPISITSDFRKQRTHRIFGNDNNEAQSKYLRNYLE